jgi:tRNA G18 (ribose-2'-O)-methylase SpoU
MIHRKRKNPELGRISPEEFKESEKAPLILVLDDVRSLNNVGSIFRTADAFRVQKIYLCGITPRPPHKDIHKTALGATDSVHWEYVEDVVELVKKLKDEGVRILSVEQAEASVSLDALALSPHQTFALVFGHEVKGVKQEVVSMSHQVVEIPQFGTKHSLNIAVSVGIVLWECFSHLKPEGLD